MFILDTDHIGIIQRASGEAFTLLRRRIATHSQTDCFTTIISFHEQILGWNAYIAKANDSLGVARGYGKLESILTDFARTQVLPFGSAAAEVFDDLRRQKIRVGTMDLRIASIALSTGMTVLTRNTVDFEKVPNLNFEDWTSS